MKKYKGYHIDHIHFNSEAEIDKFLEEQALEAYKTACKIFLKHSSMEAFIYCEEKAEVLAKRFGYSTDRLEEIEVEVFMAA